MNWRRGIANYAIITENFWVADITAANYRENYRAGGDLVPQAEF